MRRVVKPLTRLFDARARLARRVKSDKRSRTARGDIYRDHPRLSMIVLSFNHRANVKPILDGLRRTSADELIICEDGSLDGSEKVWLRCLTGANEFLIRSHDLHEIRAYNRAIDYARGEFVCVLQDDDIPGSRGDWADRAVALFDQYPKLAVLGAHRGIRYDLNEGAARLKASKFGLPANMVRPIPFVDPLLGFPFMYVQTVNIGPVFFRREIFRCLGGFDLQFSAPGEPGIRLDVEISLKAWSLGWHVGLFDPPDFRRRVGGSGTKLFGEKELTQNKIENLDRLRRAYMNAIPEIDRMVVKLNSRLSPSVTSAGTA